MLLYCIKVLATTAAIFTVNFTNLFFKCIHSFAKHFKLLHLSNKLNLLSEVYALYREHNVDLERGSRLFWTGGKFIGAEWEISLVVELEAVGGGGNASNVTVTVSNCHSPPVRNSMTTLHHTWSLINHVFSIPGVVVVSLVFYETPACHFLMCYMWWDGDYNSYTETTTTTKSYFISSN